MMDRPSIFQRVADSYSVEREVERIRRLFEDEDLLFISPNKYTIRECVEQYCFAHWKNRGHCVDLDDYLDAVEYDWLVENSKKDIGTYLTLIELILNMWKMVQQEQARKKIQVRCYYDFDHLCNIMLEELSHFNHKAEYDPDREQVLVVEDSPEVTAVAEMVEPDLALNIIKYNHRSNEGNIAGKKAILLAMGNELEPKRETLKAANRRLESGIFYMLNNLDLRHNNRSEGDRNYKEPVAKMEKETLEGWYDELYHMILFAFLTLEEIEREKKVETLKEQIESTPSTSV